MFHSRRSRESRAIDSGALAAASAIGRALDAKGTKVDAEKLPRYGGVSRSNSMMRTSSITRGPNSRTPSLRSLRDSRRASSLQSNSARRRQNGIEDAEFFDAEDTFHAFGGAPVPARAVTVKKYVPGPNGLVTIEVPISEVTRATGSRNSRGFSRSASMNSGLDLKSDFLGPRSPATALKSQRRVSGPPAAPAVQSRGASEPKKASRPVAQEAVVEETAEQLQQDETQTQDRASSIVTSASPVSHKTGSVASETKPIIKLKSSPLSVEQHTPPVVLISPADVDVDKQTNNEGKQDLNLNGEDASKVLVNEQSTSNKENVEKENEAFNSSSGSSMAQYIRSANNYLNKRSSDNAKTAQEAVVEREPITSSFGESTSSLTKVPSPKKSALKKTTSQNSAQANYEGVHRASKAQDAYISLTTAENTRLNAQLYSEPPSRRSSMRKPRPSSMLNGKPGNNIPVAAAPKAKRNTMDFTPQQTQPPARSSRRPDVHSKRIAAVKPPANPAVSSAPLYPKEPAKRSSFEKQRPTESNIGFKKLSLRDEVTDIMYEKSALSNNFHGQQPGTPVKTAVQPPQPILEPTSNANFTSRFQDSDSDDELLGTPANFNSAPAPQPANGASKLFKKKNKINLEPPQPQFLQSASAPTSQQNTPVKKISHLSLRATSVASEQSPVTEKKNRADRFFSDTLPARNSEPGAKKKVSLGKKLKKIFGRNK